METRLKAVENDYGPSAGLLDEVNDVKDDNFCAILHDIQLHANEQLRSGEGTRHGIHIADNNGISVNDFHMRRAT